jgi:hypothetical protein
VLQKYEVVVPDEVCFFFSWYFRDKFKEHVFYPTLKSIYSPSNFTFDFPQISSCHLKSLFCPQI